MKNNSFKILFILMLVLLISGFVLLRIDNNICKIIGISLIPIIIILGFIMIKINTKR